MNVSLNQAVEIHAKVLKRQFGDAAPHSAARHCLDRGDDEGHAVWLRVAAVAEMLLKTTSRDAQIPARHVVDRRLHVGLTIGDRRQVVALHHVEVREGDKQLTGVA